MQTAVLVCRLNMEVSYLNAAAEQLLRTPGRTAGRHHLKDLLPGNPELLAALKEAARTEQPISQREVRLQRPTPASAIVVDCVATPTEDNGLLIELTNVDRLVRLNRESANREVHAINRAVVQGLGHEVKNPLGGLRGAAQLLERELTEPSLRDYTGVIIKEADRLRDLVDRMVGPGKPRPHQPVNVHELFEHVRTLVLSDAPPGLRIKRDYDPSLPTISGDFDSLVQAVLNIVLNASQAVEFDGVVTLRSRSERQRTIAGQRRRAAVRLEIHDNGPGVPMHLVDQIFIPMVSYRDDGTGLGLSIAQDVVNRHAGVIELDSQVGDTRFMIYIPVGEK